MWRTALLSILCVLAGWTTVNWLTHGFQVWTDEDARRLEVALQPVPAPAVGVEGPDVTAPNLRALLAEGDGITIVDFIYTDCLTVCLTLGSVFQQLQTDLKAHAESGDGVPVQLLSISFDGGKDDPEALRGYARRFGAEADFWRLVRVPDPRQEQELLRRLGIVVVPDGRGDYEHNAALLIFDADGRMLRIFDMEERELALNYARHLARKAPPQGPEA